MHLRQAGSLRPRYSASHQPRGQMTTATLEAGAGVSRLHLSVPFTGISGQESPSVTARLVGAQRAVALAPG